MVGTVTCLNKQTIELSREKIKQDLVVWEQYMVWEPDMAIWEQDPVVCEQGMVWEPDMVVWEQDLVVCEQDMVVWDLRPSGLWTRHGGLGTRQFIYT